MFDVVILGGSVVDGTGAIAYRADVGIKGETIAEIGDLSQYEARRVINATGALRCALGSSIRMHILTVYC